MLAQVLFCKACEQPFSAVLTAAEMEASATVLCPLCGSDDVEERLATVYETDSRETA